MDLTVPTPEGPFESITFLGDRMDWPAWYDDVTTISKALDVWKYVNPDVQTDICEPTKPSLPPRPQLNYLTTREPYETDKVFDLRAEQERHSHSLSVREYDILYEQYRMHVADYLQRLTDYTTSKDRLQKLYRIIYRSIPDRYRAYLKLDNADTPRSMVRSLRARIKPSSDKDRAAVALRMFNSKLNVQPTDDMQEFIEAVALATAELHRFKGNKFDEGTAAKDLLRALQVLDKPFADAWSGKEGKKSVLGIVEEFKHKMRRDDDTPYLREEDVGAQPVHIMETFQSTYVPFVNDSGSDLHQDPVPDPIPMFDVEVNENGSSNGHGGSKSAKKGKRGNGDVAMMEEFAKSKGVDAPALLDQVSKAGVDIDMSPAEKFSQLKKEKHSKAKKGDATNGFVGEKSSKKKDLDAPQTEKHTKPRKDDVTNGPTADKFSKKAQNDTPGGDKLSGSRNGTADFPPKEKPLKSKKKTEAASLIMTNCPGCEMRHLVRDDAWWENCYVYYKLSGLENVPDNFYVTDRKLDLVFSRLQDCPEEMRRSEAWASGKNGSNGNSGKTDKTEKSGKKGKGDKSKGANGAVKQPQKQNETEELDWW
ncbi:hypothetical protein QQS21_010801 [Conoideocrella luteorostrata]|uniref:Uncharacterized protein n=1 Tax=Conoideocrella luteorostrata TaxID=1105319 RepID=A0AAJ0CEB3_9HYPO|nr:hypothetical protein QQS21_010801 [Conoideocrella luteorostrata]